MNATTATTAINAAKTVILAALAVFAGLVVTGLIVAAITGDLHAPSATAVDTSIAKGPIGCWAEPNAAMPQGVELLQGPISAAPVGSVIADCPQ